METIIVIMGLAGSGKTTISKEIEAKISNSYYVSSGDIVRNIYKNLNDVDKVKQDLDFISKHGLSQYNDEIEEEIFNKLKFCMQEDLTIILDGYPRSIEQLNRLLKLPNVEFIFVYIDVCQGQLFYRLSVRNREDFSSSNTNILLEKQATHLYDMLTYIKEEFEDMNSNVYLMTFLNEGENDAKDISNMVTKFYNKFAR
jgi:adenylate kinase family enzyme